MNPRNKVKVEHWRGVQAENAGQGAQNGDLRSWMRPFTLSYFTPVLAEIKVRMEVARLV